MKIREIYQSLLRSEVKRKKLTKNNLYSFSGHRSSDRVFPAHAHGKPHKSCCKRNPEERFEQIGVGLLDLRQSSVHTVDVGHAVLEHFLLVSIYFLGEHFRQNFCHVPPLLVITQALFRHTKLRGHQYHSVADLAFGASRKSRRQKTFFKHYRTRGYRSTCVVGIVQGGL